MKKLFLMALMGVLLLPALPGAAQSPTPVPTSSTAPAFQQTTTTSTLTYAGRGLTNGLSMTIDDQSLQAGVTASRVANAVTAECAGRACASAAGAAPPVGESAIAVSPGNPGPDSVPRFDLGEDTSPATEQVLTATIGSAEARTTDLPLATGTANGLELDLTLTPTIVGQLPAAASEGLEDALDEIAAALGPVADAAPTGTIGSITDVLDSLVVDLTTSPLLRIQSGQSTSSTDFETRIVSATSSAAGAVIIVLPTADSTTVLPEGLAVIEVGPSTAAATANGTTRATAIAAASVASITLLPGLLDAIPGLDPDTIDDLPLGDILDLLPPEIRDLLPFDDLPAGLAGVDGVDADEGLTVTSENESIGRFLQADEDSGGFVIEVETGTEPTCILEDTPLETCVRLGGTSQTFTADGLGVGVLATGVDVSLLRGLGEEAGASGLPLGDIPGLADQGSIAQVPTGPGLIEANIGQSEAGVAAAFAQVPPPVTRPTTPTRPTLPQTGADSSFIVPSLALMVLSGVALATLRRRRDV